ncbi:amidase C869.01-like protein [Trifolium pratense]|uniref:Amidase C869.01-like protein n=1 Tax=Trifolium pratense TaxID=57577 RepID=A0A2K3NG85_TRIPR|nr:probable amidase At4g34880 [Trifolium pratense]PNY02044.1 amidase C869.01-like protein [Trifolium pratense]
MGATTTKVSIFLILFSVSFRGFINAKDECLEFEIIEATIEDLQKAFTLTHLTSRKLVDFYLNRIELLNPILGAVLEINPDALDQADKADRERRREDRNRSLLHGIPVLLKDSIATFDKLNTTAGSFALLGSKVPRDAHVVSKLRDAGAIILGKTSLSEWYGIRSHTMPEAWCARGGFALDPYVESKSPCGSSSGSAISVATNMVAVSLGTETDGSIICPADHNSVVGIKPTVGLTSRDGVIPISPRQDTIGPIGKTVSDAVLVLDVIVGFDPRDYEATKSAAKLIPSGGYKQFLNKQGLKGKKIGVLRNPFLIPYKGSNVTSIFEDHLNLLRERGATVVDNLEVENLSIVLDSFQSGEMITLLSEFKLSINKYLQELIYSPVRSLAEIIEFNINNPILEKTNEYGQDLFMASEMTNGFGKTEIEAVKMMHQLSKNGFERLINNNQLDALLTIGSDVAPMLAIGGYPAISVPAGYDNQGMPFGICFGGLKGTEPKLIEIAYDFEQATRARRPPPRF